MSAKQNKTLILGHNMPCGRNELNTADVVLKATGEGRSSFTILKDSDHPWMEGLEIWAIDAFRRYL